MSLILRLSLAGLFAAVVVPLGVAARLLRRDRLRLRRPSNNSGWELRDPAIAEERYWSREPAAGEPLARRAGRVVETLLCRTREGPRRGAPPKADIPDEMYTLW